MRKPTIQEALEADIRIHSIGGDLRNAVSGLTKSTEEARAALMAFAAAATPILDLLHDEHQ